MSTQDNDPLFLSPKKIAHILRIKRDEISVAVAVVVASPPDIILTRKERVTHA